MNSIKTREKQKTLSIKNISNTSFVPFSTLTEQVVLFIINWYFFKYKVSNDTVFLR
jgi:uncharacterized membrane protein YvbJ